MQSYLNSLAATAALVLTAGLFTGCEKKSDPVTQAGQADKKAGIDAPGIEEVKAIAEEGCIYGLPLVMNYTANYQFWLDKSSSQYKCPMNQLFSERRVFTYKDTAVVVPIIARWHSADRRWHGGWEEENIPLHTPIPLPARLQALATDKCPIRPATFPAVTAVPACLRLSCSPARHFAVVFASPY